ncbi:hypothetical protein FSP39_009889 [Pinctada imbricata]|uniref:Uncharacterized protein n=1 Tax=Pinctada imbricata TaxID=66713 RepID=A0AA88XTN0_PINIB|nr:hypothetical protein FSP39_009889 [Pinctada imbricata]
MMKRVRDLLLSYISDAQHLLHKQRTFKVSEVPVLFREPSVLTGYREMNKPLAYYLLSTFQLHNETLNIWTHLVAFILVIIKLYSAYYALDEYEEYQPVVLGFGICCMFYTSLSTLAHMLQTKSDFMHYTVYHLDFAVIMSWFGCFCSCFAKLKYRRPYPFTRKLWNICSFGTQIVCVFSLVILRYVDCYRDSECTLASLNHHTRVVSLVLLSMFFFCSFIPEKFYPGKFDILGMSHQLFHFTIAVATLEQFDTAIEDIVGHTHNLVSHKPKASYIYASIISYAVLATITVLMLTPRVYKRIEADRVFEEKRK